MRQKYIISSTNAVVLFAGHEVGHLQSLRITENYNLQKIKTLWKNEVQAFVPGIAEFSAHAVKAFVEYESILGEVQNIVQTINAFKDVGDKTGLSDPISRKFNNVTSGLMNSISSGVSSVMGWEDPPSLGLQISDDVYDTLNKILLGVASLGDVFTKMAFDIRVKNPVVENRSLGNLPSSIALPDLWVLRGCQLNSRNINLSIGNVVIMEEVEILAKRNYDGMVASSINGLSVYS